MRAKGNVVRSLAEKHVEVDLEKQSESSMNKSKKYSLGLQSYQDPKADDQREQIVRVASSVEIDKNNVLNVTNLIKNDEGKEISLSYTGDNNVTLLSSGKLLNVGINSSSGGQGLGFLDEKVNRSTRWDLTPSFFLSNNEKNEKKPDNQSVSESSLNPSLTNITKIDRNTTMLTLSDLEQLLSENGYLRREDLKSVTADQKADSLPTPDAKSLTKLSTGSSQLAFPQPALLSNLDLRIGTAISSGFFFFFFFTSIRPNLWLVSTYAGAYYGNNFAERSAENPVQGVYADMTLKSGKFIAQTYLRTWDFLQQIWFMYRTGQLSYDYYKKYEQLNSKFRIQDKVDAWNARFVSGKRSFDIWERENEVGRKVLAGLRTVWIVNENSYKTQQLKYNGRKMQSKYRLVQYGIDVMAWLKRLFHAVWESVIGGGDGELKELFKGYKTQISELKLETVSQRTGAAVAALVAVNLIGAMFAIAPSLLAILSITAGAVWPNWAGDVFQRFKSIKREIQDRGKVINRAEKIEEKSSSKNYNQQLSSDNKYIKHKRDNFYYFVKDNGTKRWYRTGKSLFSNIQDDKKSWSFGDFFYFTNLSKGRQSHRE